MRSLRPENFFTSHVVLHTCGPTQTVAKFVPYRGSIQYLFVVRGADKIDLTIFNITIEFKFLLLADILKVNFLARSEL